MEIIQLGLLRKRAGLTQEQVAEALNLSQPQVSRYESEPGDVSVRIAKEWAALCGDVQRTNGVGLLVNKRLKIIEALNGIYGWFQYAPVVTTKDLPDLSQMLRSIKTIARKPRIAVAGKFDAGKSTLLNYLFGGKNLPTSYQPTTSLVCHIRHISDKPSWQVEPTVIFSQGYNLDDPDNEENFNEHKLFLGSYDIINTYAQHAERLSKEAQPVVAIKDAAVAVVYIDAPILEAADFLDLPGYANNEEDSKKAELSNNIYDALIYMSTVSGFLDGQDTNYLPVLIDKLSPVVVEGKPAPLANLFVLCTQIHSITENPYGKSREQQLNDLLDGATQRVKPVLAGALKTASQRLEAPVTGDTLRQRMFGFSVDVHIAEISELFLTELTSYVGDLMPRFTFGRLAQALNVGKAKELSALSGLIKYLEKSLADRAMAEQEVKDMISKKDLSKAQFNYERKRLSLVIDECLDTTKHIVSDTYSKYVNTIYIEKQIRTSYKNKKEAEKYVPNLIIDTLTREINEEVAVVSQKFNDDLSGVLANLSSTVSHKGSYTPFDAQGAFLSALTGVGAAGALAGWAAVVAGGSNLGGYILAAKIVGWLSAMGISVGGPAVVMSTIAALGGPITIAIGIGALIAAGLFALFGSDWETRMAKKLVNLFQKQDIQGKYWKSMQKYWIDTKTALGQSMDETLKAYDRYIEERKEVLALNEAEVRQRIDDAKNVDGFLRSTPALPASI